MPELPEVEVLRRELEPFLRGKRIVRVEIRDPRFGFPKEAAEGKTIIGVRRLGKYLLFGLAEGGCLALHLGMTGKLLLATENTPQKHERMDILLSSREHLLFCDTRRLGKIAFLREEKELSEKLGLDPLSPAYTPENVRALLEGRRRLKDFLLDQRGICGIGNIYASEILFRARLHPERALSSLSEAEKARLFVAIREVLEEAIEERGTTIRDFRRTLGEEGNFQHLLAVYGKSHCPSCGTPIVRKVIASRSTYFCPRCQPPEGEGNPLVQE
jgi:formamidopyrimidine-DNA glycosylase